MIGILHGSNRNQCVFSVNNTPSLFANVTYAENANFIRNWIALGTTLDYQNDPLFNYLKAATKSGKRRRNLWKLYESAAASSSINETKQYMKLQIPTPPSIINQGFSKCPERIFVQGGKKNGTYVKLGQGIGNLGHYPYYQHETNELYCLWRHLDQKFWLLGKCDYLWQYKGSYWLDRTDTICPNQDYQGYKDWKIAGSFDIANMTVST